MMKSGMVVHGLALRSAKFTAAAGLKNEDGHEYR